MTVETVRIAIKSFFSSKSGKAAILGFLIACVLFTIIYAFIPSGSEHKDSKACTKWDFKGFYDGEQVEVLKPKSAPNGQKWTWQQCAEKCGREEPCKFWVLHETADKCTLNTNKGDEKHESDDRIGGDREKDCVAVKKKPESLLARLGITGFGLRVVIPLAIILAIIYIAYERGWYWRLWRKLFGGGGQWITLDENHGPRGTIRASIELSANFGKLFGEDGKLVSKLVEEEIEEGQEQKKMQLQYEDLKKKARELEEHRRKLGEAVGEDSDQVQETELQKKQREIEAEAEKVRVEMEMKPEERWNVAGDGDDVEAGEESMDSQTTQSARAKRAQRHGFATQDTEKAQAAAKARMTQKAENNAGGGIDDEGKFTLKFKRVDGKEFGLKYGPGLVVTSIQADSVVADWNSGNPEKAVKEGDKVTSVNGLVANGEMLKLLRSKAETELEIVFLRQPAA